MQARVAFFNRFVCYSHNLLPLPRQVGSQALAHVRWSSKRKSLHVLVKSMASL